MYTREEFDTEEEYREALAAERECAKEVEAMLYNICKQGHKEGPNRELYSAIATLTEYVLCAGGCSLIDPTTMSTLHRIADNA